jgi:hypothetical protein
MNATVKTDIPRFPQKLIEEALHSWWKQEAIERQAFAGDADKLEAGTIYDILPEIDSLTVVRSFAGLEGLLKVEIPCAIVKAGGYLSHQDMIQDLLPKLQELFEKRYGSKLN